MSHHRYGITGLIVVAAMAISAPAVASAPRSTAGGENPTVAHWTTARINAATPRDFVVDQRGLSYLAKPDGSLKPHGHRQPQLFATTPPPQPARTSRPITLSTSDVAGPSVTNRIPAPGATIAASATFSATVTDSSRVKSVTFKIVSPSGEAQSFAARASGSTYSATISGFTTGTWGWSVIARDASRRANTTTTATTTMTVNTGSSSGTNVANAPWPGNGPVQQATGRIYFEMPDNVTQTTWSGYVCSGTVATDGSTGRSVIITAAHCVYDDVYKVFARNVLFIPNQSGTTGIATDSNCNNDPLGCWTPSFGVVDTDWTTRTFPANIPWDYAYYVVGDTSAHTGTAVTDPALDIAAGSLAVQFTPPTVGAFTTAMGYSYNQDPKFMYCAEALATEISYNDWWLGQCGLSGGASGGPWMQSLNLGTGPIISLNSWGYTNSVGMAGPRLSGSSASCVFDLAKTQAFSPPNRGISGC